MLMLYPMEQRWKWPHITRDPSKSWYIIRSVASFTHCLILLLTIFDNNISQQNNSFIFRKQKQKNHPQLPPKYLFTNFWKYQSNLHYVLWYLKKTKKTTTTNLSQKSKEEIQKMNVFQTNQIVKISLWRMNTKKHKKKQKAKD